MKKQEPAKVYGRRPYPFQTRPSIDFERYIAHCRAAEGRLPRPCRLGTTSEANSLDFNERETTLEKLVASGIAADKLLPGTGALLSATRSGYEACREPCSRRFLLPPFYCCGCFDDGLVALSPRSTRASARQGCRFTS
jgi:4-hydroxy-tetrahydrodipicolinate synthase